MSANYIELAPQALTALGDGEIIFNGDETKAGSDKAIDFEKAKFAANNEVFLILPFREVKIGDYKWIRVSLSYQDGAINLLVNGNEISGTLGFSSQGQATEGSTTVPNSLFESSPIPQGSCVVTGKFENGFSITGNETKDVEVVLFS